MRYLLQLFILTISVELFAQSYPVSQLGVEQGLSNNSIVSITQDRDGFLWFGTEEGLNKFDGTRFITYYKHTQSISANELNRIYADPHEPIIWIATQRAGFNAYNYELNTLTVYTHKENIPHSLVTNDITDIKPSADGNLWISTYHRGIEYFNKNTGEFTHYNTSVLPNLCSDNVWTIMDDNNGHLYIGHVVQGMSIFSLKDKRIRNFKHNPGVKGSIPGNDVHCIYKDSNSNIWVGTEKGLALFNEETDTFVVPENAPEGLTSTIFDICQMDDNKLWIGTELHGIYIMDLKQHYFMSPGGVNIQQFTTGYNKYSLSNPTVRSIYQDSFRNIWIGTYGGGINFIGNTPPLFDAYTYSPLPDELNSLNNRVVMSLCTDKDKRLWIGTDGGGINVFDKGKRVAIYNKEKGDLTHNSVLAAQRDSENNIWLGTFYNGLNFYNAQTKRFKKILLNGETKQDVRCLFEDKEHRMWVGTHLGVFVLDIKTQKVLAHYQQEKDGLPENLVRSIHQDNQGRIWIGTFGQGLAVFTPNMKKVATFSEQEGFCSNTINYIFKDSRGQMWIGTGEGLVCFNNPAFLKYTVYGRKDGLENTFIRAITEDESGNIWLSTNAGISSFQSKKQLFLNYNYFDKTPMGSFVTAVTKDDKGCIYFGSINGVRYFDPLTVLSNREVPPVTITEMRIYAQQSAPEDLKSINYISNRTEKIALNYKQNTFSINYNVQDYALANQVDYAYRLKGLDEAWYTVTDNSVMFRNILPGEYEFEVKTRIRNQEWTDEISSLHIHISPPLWLTWWAKTIYFVLGAFMVFMLLYAYKRKVDYQSSYELEKKNHEQEQELNHERLRFYTNIAHELRTPLTLILGPLEDLQTDTQLMPKQQQKISVVHQSALRLLNLINQILEFRRTETQNKKLAVSRGNIATVVKEVGLKYKELNRKPDITFFIHTESDDMPLFFDKEVINVVLDNLISNAIKYTDYGRIEVSLYTTVKQNVSYTEIKVTDTGYGIPPAELSQIFNRYYQAKNEKQASGTGIGLALVKNLATLHEAEIRVESTLNQGSSFYFTLLTHNTYPNALHNEPEEVAKKETSSNQPENQRTDKPILLIIEDNPDIRDYINDSLADTFEVYTANEGEGGYKAAIAHIPDIIVSDIMMPGMNGITLTKIIKEDVRTSHIPIILLTAKDTLQDKEEGYESGADSYLTKPFSATLLRSRINNLLENRRKLASQFSTNLQKSKDEKSLKFKESLTQLDNEFLQNITQLIENNLDSEKIDIAYLSDKMFMSSSTLYRKVKALTGVSTNEFVRKIKMKNAEQLLLEGKYSISEVAFRVGMNSPVYFRQCFKEEFGITPSEYLKKLKEF